MVATAPVLEPLPGRQPGSGAAPGNTQLSAIAISGRHSRKQSHPHSDADPASPLSSRCGSWCNPAAAGAPLVYAARPHHRRSDFQQTLGFQDTLAEVRVQPGEAIGCDAPVAAPTHRLVAAAIDASLILVGLGVFLAIFFLSGGQVALDRQALSFILGVTAVIALFYRALWCLANGDSPGMRFAGLRLVDFDGRRPDREQRGIRQVASLLSLLSAGLGLVWALVDEENLTWHDHISKTFPTTQ